MANPNTVLAWCWPSRPSASWWCHEAWRKHKCKQPGPKQLLKTCWKHVETYQLTNQSLFIFVLGEGGFETQIFITVSVPRTEPGLDSMSELLWRGRCNVGLRHLQHHVSGQVAQRTKRIWTGQIRNFHADWLVMFLCILVLEIDQTSHLFALHGLISLKKISSFSPDFFSYKDLCYGVGGMVAPYIAILVHKHSWDVLAMVDLTMALVILRRRLCIGTWARSIGRLCDVWLHIISLSGIDRLMKIMMIVNTPSTCHKSILDYFGVLIKPNWQKP